MSPQIIALIITTALRYGPEAARIVKNMFTRPAATPPTDKEWDDLFSKMNTPYEKYIEDATREMAALKPTPTP